MQQKDYPDFSVDLVEACMKYGQYFKSFGIDEVDRMVVQYKKFWAIIKKYPDQSFAPNSEIDEVWHLHMLLPQHYYLDCLEYFGVILSHNAGFGNVEEEVPILNEIFDEGNDVWEKEYGYRLIPENKLNQT